MFYLWNSLQYKYRMKRMYSIVFTNYCFLNNRQKGLKTLIFGFYFLLLIIFPLICFTKGLFLRQVSNHATKEQSLHRGMHKRTMRGALLRNLLRGNGICGMGAVSRKLRLWDWGDSELPSIRQGILFFWQYWWPIFFLYW